MIGKNPLKETENNLITASTVIEGNIQATGHLRIEGQVQGDVTTSARIVLGATAHVQGSIKAKSAEIAGQVTGTIHTDDQLTLCATAILHGDIITPKLIFEPGARFNGKCTMPGELTSSISTSCSIALSKEPAQKEVTQTA